MQAALQETIKAQGEVAKTADSQKVQRKKAKIQQLKAEVNGLQEEKQERDEDIASMEQQLAELATQNQDLQARMKALEKNLENEEKKNATLGQQVDAETGEKKSLTKEAEALKTEAKRTAAKLAAMTQERDGLAAQVNSLVNFDGAGSSSSAVTMPQLQAANTFFKTEYGKLKAAHEKLQAKYNEQVIKSEDREEELLEEIDELKEDMLRAQNAQKRVRGWVAETIKYMHYPDSLLGTFFVQWNLMKIRHTSEDFYWSHILSDTEVTALYQGMDDIDRNLLTMGVAMGLHQVENIVYFSYVFASPPLRMALGILHLLTSHMEGFDAVQQTLTALNSERETTHLAMKQKPQLDATTAASMLTIHNTHAQHLEQYIPQVLPGLVKAMHHLRTFRDSATITPEGFLVFFNHSLNLHATNLGTNIPVAYDSVCFHITKNPTALTLQTSCQNLNITEEELMGYRPLSPPPQNRSPSRTPTPVRLRKSPSPPAGASTSAPKKTRRRKSAVKTIYQAEIEQFYKAYPKPEDRGGYKITKAMFNDSTCAFDPQPPWRQSLVLVSSNRLHYYAAPKGIRVDPRFDPIQRRWAWTEEFTTLNDRPINWPYIPSWQRQGWNSQLNMDRALCDFYAKHYQSPDPTVNEAARNCQLLSYLLQMQVRFDEHEGPIFFDPNKPVDVSTVHRLYYRVNCTAGVNVVQFERWKDTEWLIGMMPLWGSGDRFDKNIRRYNVHRSWHHQVEQRSRHKGGTLYWR